MKHKNFMCSFSSKFLEHTACLFLCSYINITHACTMHTHIKTCMTTCNTCTQYHSIWWDKSTPIHLSWSNVSITLHCLNFMCFLFEWYVYKSIVVKVMRKNWYHCQTRWTACYWQHTKLYCQRREHLHSARNLLHNTKTVITYINLFIDYIDRSWTTLILSFVRYTLMRYGKICQIFVRDWIVRCNCY